MAYSLTVETKKGQYLILPIERLKEEGLFYRCSTYKSYGLCSLEEIDLFTTQFQNELELRKTLLEHNILPINLANKELSVRYKSEGKLKKVMYDMLYQKDIEPILEPKIILKKVYDRFLSKDYEFLKKLFEHFKEDKACIISINEAINTLHNIITYNASNKYLYERDNNNNNLIERILKLLIYESTEKKYGKIEYSQKIRYKNLHHMIAFVNNYELKEKLAKEEKEEKNDTNKQSSLFSISEEGQPSINNGNNEKPSYEEINTEDDDDDEFDPDKEIFGAPAVIEEDTSLIELQPKKVKKRVKKIIPGQMSMFDNKNQG